MLVEHAPSLPEGGEWEYEYSWPGERVLAVKEGASVRLSSAVHRRDLTNRFPVVAAAMAKLHVNSTMIDGVVRALDPEQLRLFGTSHDPAGSEAGLIRFIAIDLLWLDELDVRQLPLGMRRHRLREIAGSAGLLIAPELNGPVSEMLARADRTGADGVIAKRRDSRYRPFARAGDWIRVALDHPSSSVAAKRAEGTARERRSRPLQAGDGSTFGSGWRPAMT